MFSAQNGWLRSLSSITRTTDVTLTWGDTGDYIVEAGFGHEELKFGYDNYEARIMGIGPAGYFITKIGNNSISIAFRLSRSSGTWTQHLERVR
jgi:hypothetical protein